MQLPAIQQLYTSLLGGLEQQGKTENQNILESASQRGVLRASLPVDLQTTLAQTLLGERGKLGAQQAQDVAGVNERLGSLQVQKVQGIQSLADTLYNRDLQERQFQMQQQQQQREYELAQQAAAQKASSGGGKTDYKAQTQAATSEMAARLSKQVGRDGYVGPNTLKAARSAWVQAGLDAKTFNANFRGFAPPGSRATNYGF